MDAETTAAAPRAARPERKPPAKYRLNRRAAFFSSAVFVLVACVAVAACWVQLDERRRLAYLRESAKAYFDHAEWKQASLQYANIVRIAPTDVEAWHRLGTAQMRAAQPVAEGLEPPKGALRSAVACYRRVVELDPNHLPARVWLLELDLRNGNWTEARRHARRLSQLQPDHPLLGLAWDMLPSPRAEELAAAEKVTDLEGKRLAIEALLKKTPDDLPALRSLALADASAGVAYRTEELLNRAERRPGWKPRVDCIRAECAMAARDNVAAERYATVAAASPHTAADAHRILASIFELRAMTDPVSAAFHWQQALEHCREVLAQTPGDAAAANNAAWIAGLQLGRVEEALAHTTAALAAETQPSASLLDTHGALMLAAGRAAEAVPFLERAVVAGHSPEVQFRLAKAYCTMGHRAGLGVLHDLGACPDVELPEVRQLLARAERNNLDRHLKKEHP